MSESSDSPNLPRPVPGPSPSGDKPALQSQDRDMHSLYMPGPDPDDIARRIGLDVLPRKADK